MDIDLKALLFQIINFSILLFVFKKFLFKPILKVLDERANRIKEGLSAADDNIKLRQDFELKKDQLLAQTKKEAAQIIAAAKKEAEQLTRSAQESAKNEAKKALEKERQAFQAHMDRQTKLFEKNFARIVTASTNAVLKGIVDKPLQNSIIETQIERLKPELLK